MAGQTIVFFPKYASLCGAGAPGTAYASDPFDVTAFKTVVLEVLFAGSTAGAAISLQLQESSDLITWSNVGAPLAPAVGALASVTESDLARYIRVVMTVTGADDVVSIWVKAVCRPS